MPRKKVEKDSGLVIKTSKLQEMVARAVKGAGNNKVIPITQMIAIRMQDGVFTLITTDATNTLYIRDREIAGEDFYVVVPVEQFSKLVARMTCDTITLRIEGVSLEITGNGKYLVPIQYDEAGMNSVIVQYPDPLADIDDPVDTVDIQASTVNKILTAIKPALAVTLEDPCYTGYYVGDQVVGTNRELINMLEVSVFTEPRLISAPVMDLLSVMTSEVINVDIINDGVLVFSTPDCVIYGRDLEGIEDFAIEPILDYIGMDFESVCKVSKNALLQLLDRLALFVTDYDKGGIYLTFTKEGLQVSSKSSNGVELIPYLESKDFEDFTCCMDVSLLIKQIKAQSSDSVEIWYGLDNAIKMVDDNVIQVLAVLEDDRVN